MPNPSVVKNIAITTTYSGYGYLVEATGVEPVSEIYVELTFYMVICNTDTADLGAAALSVRAQAVCNSQGACLCVYAL